jgi:hypothetical protein
MFCIPRRGAFCFHAENNRLISTMHGMMNQNYSQKLWQQDVAASELDPPKLLEIAIPYEEVLDTARQFAAQTRERICKIAGADISNTKCIDEI